jgi:SAM-dependent methyltransferase
MTSRSTITPSPDVSHAADYDAFAAIYNRWMGEDFCRRALPVIDGLLLSKLPPNASVLDLCCGSGQMARALTGRGFRVTGVDASEEMLSFARENASSAKFVRSDVRRFCRPGAYDAVLSTFNSLAHFGTVSDLETVFTNVRRSLRPGATFLFDLSMEEAYTTKWRGSFTLLADDHACIVQSTYDPDQRLGANHITVFTLDNRDGEPEAPPCYRRSDLVLTQKCHSESELRTALQHSGFTTISTFDAERDLGMPREKGRRFFLCS